MKRILFAAIAICGFASVNAQTSATSTAPINVKIEKTIEVLPDNGGAAYDKFGVTFNNPSQFGTWQSMGANKIWGFNSTDPLTYTISFVRGTIPASVGVRYSVSDTQGNTATNQAISTPFSGHFVTGGDRYGLMSFISMEANVGWGINAGDYAGTMTITATNL